MSWQLRNFVSALACCQGHGSPVSCALLPGGNRGKGQPSPPAPAVPTQKPTVLTLLLVGASGVFGPRGGR